MKKFYMAVAAAAVLAALAGCSSLPVDAGSLMSVASAGSTVSAVAQKAESKDFKSGEVLCSDGTDNDPTDMHYYVAKVMTPATEATKGQAEVLFVSDGKKQWASFVVPSHKAGKAELTVGKQVFRLNGWSGHEEKDVSAEHYRQSSWKLGTVTSTDEMFKNFVEIDGDKYDWRLVRVPDLPLN